MIKLVSWNTAHRHAAWQLLVESNAYVALLQEASIPPKDVVDRLNETDPLNVDTRQFQEVNAQHSQCTIIKLSDKVDVKRLKPVFLISGRNGDLKATHPGCLAAAIITPRDSGSFYAVSFCPEYEKPHRSTGKMSWDIVDASVHCVISDPSLLIGKRHPHGRQADPWPDELPEDSKNVPTYIHSTQTPETATSQLDYVFASESMADSVEVRALNRQDEWGPSDYCGIEIKVP